MFAVACWVIKDATTLCGTYFECLPILVFGAPYQYFFLLLSSLLLSIIPLFFTREHVYRTWRTFAAIAVPLIVILILSTPEHLGGDYVTFGISKETVSMLLSAAFLFISWVLIAWKAIKK